MAWLCSANSPFLQTPFTTDLKLCQQLLDQTAVGMAGPKTALGDAIGLGIQLSVNSDMPTRTIITSTDGNDAGRAVPPAEAARIAKDRQITFHTVAMGDPASVDEEHPTVPHDAYAMSKVCNEICGRSFHARSGTAIYALRINNVIEFVRLALGKPGGSGKAAGSKQISRASSVWACLGGTATSGHEAPPNSFRPGLSRRSKQQLHRRIVICSGGANPRRSWAWTKLRQPNWSSCESSPTLRLRRSEKCCTSIHRPSTETSFEWQMIKVSQAGKNLPDWPLVELERVVKVQNDWLNLPRPGRAIQAEELTLGRLCSRRSGKTSHCVRSSFEVAPVCIGRFVIKHEQGRVNCVGR